MYSPQFQWPALERCFSISSFGSYNGRLPALPEGLRHLRLPRSFNGHVELPRGLRHLILGQAYKQELPHLPQAVVVCLHTYEVRSDCLRVRWWRCKPLIHKRLLDLRPPCCTARHLSSHELPRLHTSLTGDLEQLPPPSRGPLKWYNCGPTVYDAAHLGHARTYVSLDVLRRLLTDHFGYRILYAMGVTDVDDKIIARAREGGATGADWGPYASLARRWEASFMEDMDTLGVQRPDAVLRVTEHMDAIHDYVERLLHLGAAYKVEGPQGGVYFSVTSLGAGYGKLGNSGTVEVDASAPAVPASSAAPTESAKRDPADFALWKAAKEGEPSWDSPFGRGRPGWHIECSAMTHALFGSDLDVHTGGIDLKFPHHTNEIAQCDAHASRGLCCAPPPSPPHTGTAAEPPNTRGIIGAPNPDARSGGQQGGEWCRHWLHTGHVHIEGLKMSKSLKNFITVKEYIEAHGGGAVQASQDFRIFCLMHRYTAPVTFSYTKIAEAGAVRARFQRFFSMAAHVGANAAALRRWGAEEADLHAKLADCTQQVHGALGCDADTPAALRLLQELSAAACKYADVRGASAVPEPVLSCARYVERVLSAMGLALGGQGGGGDAERLEGVMNCVIEFRSELRNRALAEAPAGNALRGGVLSLCDDVRNRGLPRAGVVLEDTKDGGARWFKADPKTDAAVEAVKPAASREPTTAAAPLVPVTELFKQGDYADLYCAWDDDGMPTHDKAGEPLSKNARKKLLKAAQKHAKRLQAGPELPSQ
ncbi:putative cysteinyltRNA synthetase [Tribonema minus]|uniref:cysteine--tRNA ligase n=1 Tax=Tribonema minus TaxID=303371 RepID=A0A836CJU0_9STRA|nr:putative cysteinyltRNA synthetase [Tribonema minus]